MKSNIQLMDKSIYSEPIKSKINYLLILCGAIVLFMIYFLPLFAIALYALVHLFIFGTDFTNTKFVQKVIAPLLRCEKRLDRYIYRKI